MPLGKFPVPGRPTIWMIVGQGSIALAVGAKGRYLDIFTLIYPFSPLFPLSGRRPDIYTEILSQRAAKPNTINQSMFHFDISQLQGSTYSSYKISAK